MILNRQLIKILEDLGIHAQVFKNLQTLAVDRLRYLTTTGAVNTATFLEEMDCPRATRIPSLIRLLNQVGLDHRQDHFLYSIVEMVLVTKLRDIKYRGRIPVDSGYTLYGIMDETGYLQDGEIYVSIPSPEHWHIRRHVTPRQLLIHNIVLIRVSGCDRSFSRRRKKSPCPGPGPCYTLSCYASGRRASRRRHRRTF